jgi:hypothetical protein
MKVRRSKGLYLVSYKGHTFAGPTLKEAIKIAYMMTTHFETIH